MSASDSLTEVYDRLVISLGDLKVPNHAFVSDIEAIRTTLYIPLDTEKVSFSALRGGIKVDNVINLGERVAAFRRLVEEKQKELSEYWKEWKKLQSEIVTVGIDTLGMSAAVGEEAFGGNAITTEWREKKALIDSEWQTNVEAVEEEIVSGGREALKKLTAAEKVSVHMQLK